MLLRFALRFALVDYSQHAGMWLAMIPRGSVQKLSEEIERELPHVELAWSLIEGTTDVAWHEDIVDHMRNVSASRT